MSLLGLPREIRLQILEQLVTSSYDPPSSPSTTQHGRRQASESSWSGRGVWELPPQNPALYLLLLNKQIAHEVRDIINRQPPNYNLDIMFLKRCGLWTNWPILGPPKTQYIDTVNVTFRIFDPPDDLDRRFDDTLDFRGGDGGPETSVWAFYTLLKTLLEKGPGNISRRTEGSESVKSRCVVKNIVINVLSPTDGAAHKSIGLKDKDCLDSPTRFWHHLLLLDTEIPIEERLVNYMTRGLRKLLDLSYYTLNYAMIVCECVTESIVFQKNGHECERFDIEELVSNHQIRWWGETPDLILERIKKYDSWRSWLDDRREKMKQGLELDDDAPVARIM